MLVHRESSGSSLNLLSQVSGMHSLTFRFCHWPLCQHKRCVVRNRFRFLTTALTEPNSTRTTYYGGVACSILSAFHLHRVGDRAIVHGEARLCANTNVVPGPEVAAPGIDGRVPLAELVERDAGILVDLVASLAVANLVVLLALRVKVGHLGLRAASDGSSRNVDADVEVYQEVRALCLTWSTDVTRRAGAAQNIER